MNSPLKTLEYFFPVVQVIAEPNFPDDLDVNKIDYDINTGVAQSKEDERKYQCHLEITSIGASPEKEQKNAYKVNMVVIGYFKVSKTWPDPERLVAINGASILYSAAREYLITVSSRGPWGALMLPTVSFNTTPDEKESKEGREKTS